MSIWQAALTFGAATLVTAAIVKGISRLAPQLGLVDLPNERSLHSKPTPRGGGLAIVVVCTVGLGVSAILGLRPPWPAAAGYLVGAAMIAAVSLMDDVRRSRVSVRLAIQIAAALVLALSLATQHNLFPLMMSGPVLWIAVGVAVLWTVGLTNAYNFMDGIDGLAGTQGLLGGLVWAILAWANGLGWLADLSLLVAGSCLGFLAFNWSPARIFMGDVGSAFLGFTFAFIALAGPRHVEQLIGAVLISWPLLFDVAFTLVRRLLRHENVLVAHRSHLYQRLVLAGSRPAKVASLYGLLAVLAASMAVLLWSTNSMLVGVLAVVILVAASLGLWGVVITAEHRHARFLNQSRRA